VACAPAVGSMGTPALKYSTTSRTLVRTALWKKFSEVNELPHGQCAEPEGVSRVMGDFLPPNVLGVVWEAVRTQDGRGRYGLSPARRALGSDGRRFRR
jgi:hypothetical protein